MIRRTGKCNFGFPDAIYEEEFEFPDNYTEEEMDTQGHCWYKNGEPVMQDMNPNDFCSYGERKEQEEC